jgi:hypothetical protein
LNTPTTVPFVLALALWSCVFAPPLYWAEAIHAHVIDAETGAPVEGAVVVEETTTDANGDFTFGKWGPKKRPAYAVLDTAPWLVIFKTGYQHRFLPNSADSNESVRRSDWNERNIELKRFVGTPEQRVDALRTVLSLSELQPLMLGEIAKEGRLYRRVAPAFFDHVQGLATERREAHQ